jgi:cytochrome c-type biogenesis protein CcsB
LRIEGPTLRAALSVQPEGNHIAPRQLADALVQDYRTNREAPFPVWAENLLARDKAGEDLADLERLGLELAERLWSYENHRMARGIEVLPVEGDENGAWMPLARLLLMRFDDATDPSGDFRNVQSSFAEARRALRDRDAAAFNRASEQFLTALRQLGAATDAYPAPRPIALEVAYNQCAPFRIAWVLMLIATIACLLRAGSGWKSFYALGVLAYVGGLAAMLAGFVLRAIVAGRPPVTNMYESVVYVGAGVALFGLIFELRYRRKYFLSAAATISTLILILADNSPLVLDPAVRPLEPVLRSNFWLVTHVLTITLSYAALALALGLGNIALGYGLFRSPNHDAVAALGRFTYKVLQLGVLLLAAGIILGGVWADYSWGRFWGWDPKEVWALVALLAYLAVLHARFAGWVGERGLAALSVTCFALVVMAWYGVNFVLGAGLHSYGFGGGGQGWVYGAVVLQLIYVGIAVVWTPEAGPCELADSIAASGQVAADRAAI